MSLEERLVSAACLYQVPIQLESAEGAVCLYQVPTQLISELAINSMEDDARQAVMALTVEDQATLKQIVSHLEGLFGENMMVLELRQSLFGDNRRTRISHTLR